MIEQYIESLSVSRTSKKKILDLFAAVGLEQAFGRSDMIRIIGITASPAGELIKKMKSAGLLETVKGFGKGKYRFTEPKG